MKRSLSLRRESLSDLTPGDLAAVVGAAPPTFNVGECLEKFFDTVQPTRCLCPYE